VVNSYHWALEMKVASCV